MTFQRKSETFLQSMYIFLHFSHQWYQHAHNAMKRYAYSTTSPRANNTPKISSMIVRIYGLNMSIVLASAPKGRPRVRFLIQSYGEKVLYLVASCKKMHPLRHFRNGCNVELANATVADQLCSQESIFSISWLYISIPMGDRR